LVDLFGDRGGDDGISDIGVDLHQEVPADDHRLAFRVIDVRGNDGAAARDLVAHEFRRADIGDRGAEALAGRIELQIFPAEILADGDVFHLRRDDAGARIGELRYRLAALGAQRLTAGAIEQRHRTRFLVIEPIVFRLHIPADIPFDIAAGENPFLAHRREAGADIDRDRRVGIRTGRIVSADRLFLRARLEVDLAHRDAQIGMLFAGDEYLARRRQRAGRNFEALADSAFGHDDLLPDTRNDPTRFSGERVAQSFDKRRSCPYAGTIRIRFKGFAAAFASPRL